MPAAYDLTMMLAEDLLLLLTDDTTGKLLVPGSQLDVALGGAQLVELAVAGRVDVDDRKRLVVPDASPTGEPLLDRALETAQRRAGRKPSAVIGELGKGLRAQLHDRLETAGILRREQGRLLGLFPTTSWPAASARHEAAVRAALVGPLVHGVTPDPRTASLVALLHALRATHKVVVPKEHGIRRRDLDRRAKEVAEGSWGSQAVRQSIDAMTAAITAGVAAATIGATAGGGG
jgi:hypothetical protein